MKDKSSLLQAKAYQQSDPNAQEKKDSSTLGKYFLIVKVHSSVKVVTGEQRIRPSSPFSSSFHISDFKLILRVSR